MFAKAQQNVEQIRFSGGDNLTGIDQIYHEIMMLNELKGGYGAYQLSYAGGESGLSFGGNQMDMSENASVANVFIEILTYAKNEENVYFFSEKEIQSMVGKNNLYITKKHTPPESIFGDNLSRINAALSSEYGRSKIDATYVEKMQESSHHIEIVLDKMTNPAAKKFYDSTLGRALLFDYHNQYNIEITKGSFLVHFINGKGKKDFSTGLNIISPKDVYTLDNHKAYIYSTEQFAKVPQNCINRIENVLNVVKKFTKDTIIPSKELHDFGFTFDPLKGRWKIYPNLKMPEIPPAEGSQSFYFNTVTTNYFFLPSSPQEILFKKNTFYYLADLKKLFYVSNELTEFLPPCTPAENLNKWNIHSIGLSPIIPKLFLEFSWQINPQNYVLYIIRVKKTPIEINELISCLGETLVGI